MLTRQTSVGSCQSKQQGIIISGCGRHVDKFTDHANTLLARDYKGFGNQGMTGIIVHK